MLSVPCSDIIGSARSVSADYRVVAGAVAAPPARLQRAARSADARWKFWSKAGLVVRARRGPVIVSVPHAWRGREAITWGNGRPAVSALRIAPCPPSPNRWNAYAGGFFTHSRTACVPVTFRVGSRARTVWFGIGRRCRTRS